MMEKTNKRKKEGGAAGGISLDAAARNYYGDPSNEKLDELVNCAKIYVNYFASIYGGGCSIDDLRQEGIEGLLKAVKHFNPALGVSFTTYAGHCIIGEIRHYVRKEIRYYRPGSVADLQYKIGLYIEETFKETGEAPSLYDISLKFNVKEDSINEIMKAGLVNFDEVKITRIANRQEESFKLILEDRIMIEQAMEKLSEMQRKVMYMLFYNGMTQEDASAKLGINQRKVSRLKQKSLLDLKKILMEAGIN